MIRGNAIQKGRLSDNIHCAICIGEEIAPPGGGAGTPKREGTEANPNRGIVVAGNSFRNDSGAAEKVFVWNRGPHKVTLQRNVLTGLGTAYFVGPKPEKTPRRQ